MSAAAAEPASSSPASRAAAAAPARAAQRAARARRSGAAGIAAPAARPARCPGARRHRRMRLRRRPDAGGSGGRAGAAGDGGARDPSAGRRPHAHAADAVKAGRGPGRVTWASVRVRVRVSCRDAEVGVSVTRSALTRERDPSALLHPPSTRAPLEHELEHGHGPLAPRATASRAGPALVREHRDAGRRADVRVTGRAVHDCRPLGGRAEREAVAAKRHAT